MTSVPAFEGRAEANPNANTASAITTIFFPMMFIPPVVWPIEPGNDCEVAKELVPRLGFRGVGILCRALCNDCISRWPAPVATARNRFTGSRSLAATVWRFRTLLFFHKREVRFVPFAFHRFDRDKMKGSRVNDVTLPRGRLRVGKHIAEVSVTSFGADLGSLHVVRSIDALHEEIF